MSTMNLVAPSEPQQKSVQRNRSSRARDIAAMFEKSGNCSFRIDEDEVTNHNNSKLNNNNNSKISDQPNDDTPNSTNPLKKRESISPIKVTGHRSFRKDEPNRASMSRFDANGATGDVTRSPTKPTRSFSHYAPSSSTMNNNNNNNNSTATSTFVQRGNNSFRSSNAAPTTPATTPKSANDSTTSLFFTPPQSPAGAAMTPRRTASSNAAFASSARRFPLPLVNSSSNNSNASGMTNAATTTTQQQQQQQKPAAAAAGTTRPPTPKRSSQRRGSLTVEDLFAGQEEERQKEEQEQQNSLSIHNDDLEAADEPFMTPSQGLSSVRKLASRFGTTAVFKKPTVYQDSFVLHPQDNPYANQLQHRSNNNNNNSFMNHNNNNSALWKSESSFSPIPLEPPDQEGGTTTTTTTEPKAEDLPVVFDTEVENTEIKLPPKSILKSKRGSISSSAAPKKTAEDATSKGRRARSKSRDGRRKRSKSRDNNKGKRGNQRGRKVKITTRTYPVWEFGKMHKKISITPITPVTTKAATEIQRMMRGWYQRLRYEVQYLTYQLDNGGLLTSRSLDRVWKEVQERKDRFYNTLKNKVDRRYNQELELEQQHAAEGQQIIAYLRKDNRKIRQENEDLVQEIKLMKHHNKRMEVTAKKIKDSHAELQAHVKRFQETHDHLAAILPLYQAKAEAMEEAADLRQQYCLSENKTKVAYMKLVATMVELVEERCKEKQPKLVDEVVGYLLAME